MINSGSMDQFMALSSLYLIMHDKASDQMTVVEIEDLIVAINDDHPIDPHYIFQDINRK